MALQVIENTEWTEDMSVTEFCVLEDFNTELSLDDASPAQDFGPEHKYHFWRGKSGKRYLHRVYSLLECPPIPDSNFVLVKKMGENDVVTLAVGQATYGAETLNLATVRHEAALRGANEIHVFELADDPADRKAVEEDVRAGQFADLVDQLTYKVANAA